MKIPRYSLFLAMFWIGLAGADPAPSPAQLDALRARIGDLTKHLANDLAARDQLASRVREAELAIPDKRKALEIVQSARREADKRRSDLLQQQTQTRKHLDQQRDELARQLRASYMIGREPQWQLLLNQQNPAQAGRMLAYYGYFGRQQAARIQAVEQDLAKLDEVQKALSAQTEQLEKLDQAARRELSGLLAARSERRSALEALNSRVLSGTAQIAQLKQEEEALNSLLANLRRVSPDFALGPQRPFKQMQGKLPWPVPGRLSARFHQSRGGARDSAVRWTGVMIDAARSAKVRATYYGRVVYADWLQGLGLLLIIEHGDGFMTLYGHTEVLYKSVGDRVAPGDVIAGLKDSDNAPLYFEIRQGKTPLDPERWLTSSR